MKLLAIDTTEETCSAALLLDGEVGERFETVPRRHSERVLPMMDALLADAGLSLGGLDGLAFARGPGSFTGLRIAAGVIQGAALAADLPVAPVSSLRALAQGVLRDAPDRPLVLAAFDARMGEIYWGLFEVDQAGWAAGLGTEQVAAPQDLIDIDPGRPLIGAGSGWAAHGELLQRRLPGLTETLPAARVHARDVALLGEQAFNAGLAVDAGRALPVYLRDLVAKKAL